MGGLPHDGDCIGRTGSGAVTATSTARGDDRWQSRPAEAWCEADGLLGAGIAAGLAMHEASGEAVIAD